MSAHLIIEHVDMFTIDMLTQNVIAFTRVPYLIFLLLLLGLMSVGGISGVWEIH